ncbi:MAG: AraC family transcriptional regulator [Paracoccaceae bacterium]|nr:AraC family transcriptional regulator [Paracoccaceae bacterium]
MGLARLVHGGRWRVEAMRSYSRPVLIWFTRGSGRITINGATRGYGAHNAVFLPPGTMHGFDMLGQVLGFAVFLPADANLDWPEEPLHLRCREGRLQAELTGLIELLERASNGRDAHAPAELHHLAGLVSVWLKRRAAEAETDTGPRERAADRLVAAYTALVERDFRRPRGVADYAADLGITPTHLSRACRATSGRSALALLIDRRLYEARRLLRDTDRPVQNIAADTGFGSPAYFSRAFRAETGASPSEFRNARASRLR